MTGGVSRASHLWKSIRCAGGCGKKTVAIDAVSWVLCPTCANKSVADRLAAKKAKETA